MPNQDDNPKPAPKPEMVWPKIKLDIDRQALKKLGLVVVAFSKIEREFFPTSDSYYAELEVEERAADVVKVIQSLGIPVKGLSGDQYFYTNLLVDKPSLVLNLVDTLRGRENLQTSVPASLELSGLPYTGAGMEGMVIGNNRNITKRMLMAHDIPTPAFQYIRRAGTKIKEELGIPLIVKLNESGGSVGINNNAVKDSFVRAQNQVDKMITTYRMPVIVERFIDGPEITVCVFDDGTKKHVFMGEKIFRNKPDGKHFFTSIESYEDLRAYTYKPVDEPRFSKIAKLATKAFSGLYHKDYAKFDIRYDETTNTPYFTDSNPNTAFGPDMGLPFTELANFHGISFSDLVAALLAKYAKSIK